MSSAASIPSSCGSASRTLKCSPSGCPFGHVPRSSSDASPRLSKVTETVGSAHQAGVRRSSRLSPSSSSSHSGPMVSIVYLLRGLDRRGRRAAAQLLVLDHLADRAREPLDVLVRHEQAVAVVVDDVGGARRAVEATRPPCPCSSPPAGSAGSPRSARRARTPRPSAMSAPMSSAGPSSVTESASPCSAIRPSSRAREPAAAAEPQPPVGVGARGLGPRGDQQVKALLVAEAPRRVDGLGGEVGLGPGKRPHGVGDAAERDPALRAAARRPPCPGR